MSYVLNGVHHKDRIEYLANSPLIKRVYVLYIFISLICKMKSVVLEFLPKQYFNPLKI